MANLVSEKLLENTREAAIKWLAIEEQREEQRILQKNKKLNLSDSLTGLSICMIIRHLRIDIVHASAMDSYTGLCTT